MKKGRTLFYPVVSMKARYSRPAVVIVLVLMWTLIKTGFDVLTIKKPFPSKALKAGRFQKNDALDASMRSSEEEDNINQPIDEISSRHKYKGLASPAPVLSKSRIQRRSSQEVENITLLTDTLHKQEMTKYVSRTEAEEEIKQLYSELDRLFHHTDVQSTEASTSSELEKLLAHMMKDHSPPANHYYGHDVKESDRKSVNRKLPDSRPPYCRNVNYNLTALPTVSVITPFHNEAITMLLRHIHAVINTSPKVLLREIILVDDKSTLENLGPDLEEYIKKLDKRIRLIRNKAREGVSRSRMIGADAATSDVLIFLDSHMECSTGWLEPILSRLVSQPNAVLQPVLPHIHAIENTYHEGLFRGAFDWDLSYVWSPLPPYLAPDVDPGGTFSSPALTGCAIAVLRPFFYHLGGFDSGMEIWGGEHFELSFRAWMCGGRVETVTCSIVGHLYKLLTYSFEENPTIVKMKNNLRLAEIWMDEYKDIVYAGLRSKNPQLPVFTEDEWKSIEKRKELREKLQCGTFSNYMAKFPELKVPSKDHVYFGAVRNTNTSYCLLVQSNGHLGVGEGKCGDWRLRPQEQFIIDKWGRLMFEDVCIGIEKDKMLLLANHDNCLSSNTSNFKWDLNPGPEVGLLQLSVQTDRYCAIHDRSDTADFKQGVVKMIPCTIPQQLWSFAYKFDFRTK